MVVAYSMIFCFMPKMVAIMVALRPVTAGGRGGAGSAELWGFWWAFLKTHCPGVPWCWEVRFCLASLVLLAQAKSFSLSWLGETSVEIFQLPQGELNSCRSETGGVGLVGAGLPCSSPNPQGSKGENAHQETPDQLFHLP